MSKPLLYDVFSGAGGAARGYMDSGFRVIGIDNKPQPRYCGDGFIQMDALEFLRRLHQGEFEQPDAIHCSPPCQFYSRLRHLPWLRDKAYWRSVPPTRERLMASGLPWVMENVADCWDMPDSIILCGQMFQRPIFRHRRFEAWPFLLLQPPHEQHHMVICPGRASLDKRHHGLNAWNGEAGHPPGVQRHRANMEIDWMTGAELSQAIPPAYTLYVGTQLILHLQSEVRTCATTRPSKRSGAASTAALAGRT